MGEYLTLCELRGMAAPGKGCTLNNPSLKYCAKRATIKQWGTQRVDCTTTAIETLTDGAAALGQFPIFSPALRRAKAGTGRAIWVWIGDSLTGAWGSGWVGAGPGTGTSGDAVNIRRNKSLPALTAAALAATGVPVRSDAVFPMVGSAQTPAEQNAYNPDFVVPADWVIAAVTTRIFYRIDPGVTTGAVFTPQVNANSFEIYYALVTGNGTLTITDANGTLGTIDTGAGPNQTLGKATVTRAVSSKLPITITRSSGVAVYLAAIVPYDSTSPCVEFLNMGSSGTQASSEWVATGNGYTLGASCASFGAHMTTVQLGANDSNSAVSTATYQAALQTITAKLKAANSDVVLVKTHTAGGGYNLSAGYLAAMDTVATNNSLVVTVNFNTPTNLVAGDYFDVVHLVQNGYIKETATLASTMFPLL